MTEKTATDKQLEPLLKSNLACHMNKILTHELIEEISKQIIESIAYIVSKDA